MIIKSREIPRDMLQLEALDQRLLANHPQKEIVSQKARNLRTGYKGEISLNYTLEMLPGTDYYIIHNLRLSDKTGFFQIDTLLFSQKYALIIEAKNIYGVITYDDLGQVTRIADDGDIEEGFSNPVDQVIKQQYRLRNWLSRHDFPVFPLEKLVVYSNPRTILRNVKNKKTVSETVIHNARLFSKIIALNETYHKQAVSDIQIKEIATSLMDAHTPKEEIDIMKKYHVSYDELQRGVICPYCGFLPMQRIHGKWKCPHCKGHSRTAHQSTLKDYDQLMGRTINNREARDFLQLDSIHVTKKILQKEGLEQIGNTSARTYKLHF